MRFLSLIALLASAAVAFAADVEFVRVWPAWRDAASFERISEYFTGHEPSGREAILRTQPAQRSGYYFLTRLKNDGPLLAQAQFRVHVITPANPEPKEFVFTADVPPGRQVFHLGLTGGDWPDAKARPVAWRIELVGAGDAVLASEQSFLWSKPDGQR